MGYSRWSDTNYKSFATATASKSRGEIFTRRAKTDRAKSGQKINAEEIDYRESRDSDANPVSMPILVGLDVTGSMGIIPERLVKGGLGVLMNQLLQRRPVSDPHLLFMGIGDAVVGDRAPLQATQFESDNRICQQLTDIWIESGGGGNDFESYDLAWAFGAYRTRTDAWQKRKQKGFLFTVGDEMFPHTSSQEYIESILKSDRPQSPTPESLLAEAQKRYHVFHVIIAEGSYAKRNPDQVVGSWRERVGKRALLLGDYNKIAELIVSSIALESGTELSDVLGWWDQETSGVIQRAFS